jgi:Zinc dependent phospholipase C
MLVAGAIAFVIGFIALSAQPAFAWGPITHIALGVQVLGSVSTLEQPLQAILLSMPDAFLYGSLAPDIVQGRRIQSRLRRHSHNWATGFGLLSAARGNEEQAFALGYLAHLGADVLAHNFYLPMRWIRHFNSAIASHILSEARFDSMQDAPHRETLVKLMAIDFSALDTKLSRQIDSPLLPFRAQKRIFEGGMRRIRQWNRLILAIGRVKAADRHDAEVFCSASCSAIDGVLRDGDEAPACRFDPMGQRALRNAQRARRTLQRLARMGPETKRAARQFANTTVEELHTHLRQMPFGGTSEPS